MTLKGARDQVKKVPWLKEVERLRVNMRWDGDDERLRLRPRCKSWGDADSLDFSGELGTGEPSDFKGDSILAPATAIFLKGDGDSILALAVLGAALVLTGELLSSRSMSSDFFPLIGSCLTRSSSFSIVTVQVPMRYGELGVGAGSERDGFLDLLCI